MSRQRLLAKLDQLVCGPERQAHVAESILLTEAEAAAHCRYFDRGCVHPVRAFQQWARAAGVPVKRVGRARLYDPKVLDAFLDGKLWTRRHAVRRTA